MKKLGIMIAALCIVGFILIGCDLLNPVKNTKWQYVQQQSEHKADGYYGYTNIYHLHFKTDEIVTMEISLSILVRGIETKETYNFNGTYEYKRDVVTMTLNGNTYTGTIENDTMVVNYDGVSMTFEEGGW